MVKLALLVIAYFCFVWCAVLVIGFVSSRNDKKCKKQK